MTQVLIYEHPLNERIRVFLRTEQMFEELRYRIDRCDTAWDLKDCVVSLVTLMQLIDRTDLKSELLKELERQINIFQRLGKTPSVPQDTLERVLMDLGRVQSTIRDMSKLTTQIKEHLILQGVQLRLSLQGGICAFDLPLYHYWSHLPINVLQPQLSAWFSALQPIEHALQFLLNLIRTSQDLKPEIASEGFFQKNLDPQFACQLIRIKLPQQLGFYPEISASKHRVHVRFLIGDAECKKPQTFPGNIGFEMACCAI